MKTPRELLLEHHADAEPELDALRQRVVADLRPAQGPGWLTTAWRELVWQPRLTWAGLTALWIAIIGGNLSMRESGQRAPAPPSARVDWLQQQRTLYAEFGLLPERSSPEHQAPPGPQSRVPATISTRRHA